MARRKKAGPRLRVGRVSVYLHHGAWWVYYRLHGRPVRRKIAASRADAEPIAAQINAQLLSGTPTLVAFTPVGIAQLRQQFLDYHEHVLRSSLATIGRYRAATQHLENFANQQAKPALAHEVRPDTFAAYLRQIEVAPNGHPHTAKRKLRDKGVQFILETCRALYTFAAKRRHLPPYAGNPFAELPLDRLKIDDAKPIFVFDAATELAFFQAADSWSFALHFTLAKTGLRVGELTHLLIEDLDLEGGWLNVRNKPMLGWRIKTGSERRVPLLPEVVLVLRRVLGQRTAGPVFLRHQFVLGSTPWLGGDAAALAAACRDRQAARGPATRAETLRVARTVWRDAGAVKAERVRTAFVRITHGLGLAHATCPKSWRHTFATLLQDANVDPLVRQITLGHTPTSGGGLGMTARYTHTRAETQRQQIEGALRLWPQSLELARLFGAGNR
jgi:integrase